MIHQRRSSLPDLSALTSPVNNNRKKITASVMPDSKQNVSVMPDSEQIVGKTPSIKQRIKKLCNFIIKKLRSFFRYLRCKSSDNKHHLSVIGDKTSPIIPTCSTSPIRRRHSLSDLHTKESVFIDTIPSFEKLSTCVPNISNTSLFNAEKLPHSTESLANNSPNTVSNNPLKEKNPSDNISSPSVSEDSLHSGTDPHHDSEENPLNDSEKKPIHSGTEPLHNNDESAHYVASTTTLPPCHMPHIDSSDDEPQQYAASFSMPLTSIEEGDETKTETENIQLENTETLNNNFGYLHSPKRAKSLENLCNHHTTTLLRAGSLENLCSSRRTAIVKKKSKSTNMYASVCDLRNLDIGDNLKQKKQSAEMLDLLPTSSTSSLSSLSSVKSGNSSVKSSGKSNRKSNRKSNPLDGNRRSSASAKRKTRERAQRDPRLIHSNLAADRPKRKEQARKDNITLKDLHQKKTALHAFGSSYRNTLSSTT